MLIGEDIDAVSFFLSDWHVEDEAAKKGPEINLLLQMQCLSLSPGFAILFTLSSEENLRILGGVKVGNRH